MIVGAIIETTDSTGVPERYHNGAALVTFYTMSDAIAWARIQSVQVTFDSSNHRTITLCTVVNTDTNQRRWWFNGIEYTA